MEIIFLTGKQTVSKANKYFLYWNDSCQGSHILKRILVDCLFIFAVHLTNLFNFISAIRLDYHWQFIKQSIYAIKFFKAIASKARLPAGKYVKVSTFDRILVVCWSKKTIRCFV